MPSERLIYTDLTNNNNKFWHAETSGNTLTIEWGRVGDASQKKVRTYASAYDAEKDFNSRRNAKLRDGYTKQQTLSGTRPVNIAFVAKVQIQHSQDKETEALIDFLVKRNIHHIEGTTSIRMEAGQLTTPLGPVTSEGLDEAEVLLQRMTIPNVNLNELANKYLRIVPRSTGRRKMEGKELFGTARQLEQEQATIDSLRAVLKDMETKVVNSVDGPPVFSTKLDIINSDLDDFRKINSLFRSSINRSHQSSRLNLYKVWKMSITSASESFEKQLGNVKRLWHGTKDANLLSILKNGFIIANRGNGIAITGRMFGDGLYFSDQSTKALNYASGFWGAASERKFMLLNDVAMGREFIPSRGFSGRTCPPGYDSTFAKAGQSGVINNEMVVYRQSQINPLYLCEFR